jgi:NAD(P)-dependent dehydrogenase (short-subunit alcohol dehydrogenase family)
MGESCLGKIALITGGSRGMGQAFAQRFAAEGARVAVVGRDPERRNAALAGTLDETLELVRAVGGTAIAVRADIGDPAFDKRAIIEEVEKAFGQGPDILINVAAAPREFDLTGYKPFTEMPREWFFRTVEVNVWAAWDLAKQIVPGMRRRGAGWILNISSNSAGPRPRPTDETARDKRGGAALYGGSKAFLDRMATGAAQELYPDNIAVNNLSPTGAVATPLSTSVIGELPASAWEPIETMVEAALALCTGDPKVLTSRIAYSLPLLAELNRPVYTLDGKRLFEGWQPDHDDSRKQVRGYLQGH